MSSNDLSIPSDWAYMFNFPIFPFASSAGSSKDISPPAFKSKQEETLEQLMKEYQLLSKNPLLKNSIAAKLAEKEISRIRETISISKPEGPIVSLSEKIFVPFFPKYNFIGRLLGPRGMTVKRLSEETGCLILVRGRGSLRNQEREEMLRNKAGWEHLKEELHVVIQCEDAERRARQKMAKAEEEVRKLMVPMENDKEKEIQFFDLAILNGTLFPPQKPPTPLMSNPIPNPRPSLVTLRFIE